jgi:hypothetical protein
MCQVDLTPRAELLVADLLRQIVEVLAAEDGCDPADVRVGPVDFGAAHEPGIDDL